jgi:hypothetical protein
VVQVTHGVTIAASPDEVWPWLLETALGRGGLVTIDVPPRVGDLLPPTPDFDDGLEVLALEPRRTLVLGSLYDADARRPRRFSAERPDTFWRSTWSFVLEAHEGRSTRLYVRARATFGGARRLQAEWIRPVHHLMDAAQLHHLKRCAEGAAAPAIGGGRVDDAAMVAAFVTPAKEGHVHWGVDRETADRVLPGDELVQAPSWCWTHGIEIAGSASEVWSWLARLGEADNGFYSYQWLEGPVGAGVGESPVASPGPGSLGDPFVIHPRIPPLTIAGVEKGHFLLLRAGRDGRDSADGERWATLSWLFLVEGLDDGRSRLISRYRGAMSDDLKTRLNFGPALLEPVGFAMDRRVLLGVKARVESRRRSRRRPNEAPATKRARA